MNNVKVSRNYPPYYPKKLMSPCQDLYFFAQWIALQDKTLPVQ